MAHRESRFRPRRVASAQTWYPCVTFVKTETDGIGSTTKVGRSLIADGDERFRRSRDFARPLIQFRSANEMHMHRPEVMRPRETTADLDADRAEKDMRTTSSLLKWPSRRPATHSISGR